MSSLRQQFLQHLAPTSPAPLLFEFIKANGCYFYTENETPFLDLISGIGVSNIGHGNRQVIDAIKNQSEQYLHQMVYGEYIQKPQVKLAEKLISILPQNFENVFFVNSGSEAVEGALKLAIRYTGKHKIIAAKNSYHGSTTGALSLMDNSYYTSKFDNLLNKNVSFINFNSLEDIEKIDNETACVILETIQGEAGYIPATEIFLKALRKKCDETGTLLIFDEIQCGIGRTGKWFAFEHYDVVPDILLLAKALGAGMPLGAFISSAEIMKSLSDEPVLGHITTFGGHPVSCAAALAGIEYIEQNNILKKVQENERISLDFFNTYFPENVSGKGLMWAIDFKNETLNKNIINECISKNIIADWFLHAPNKLRIAPPLIIEKQILVAAYETILEAYRKYS